MVAAAPWDLAGRLALVEKVEVAVRWDPVAQTDLVVGSGRGERVVGRDREWWPVLDQDHRTAPLS